MREHKYRGKRLDNGEWIYGDLLQLGGNRRTFIFTDDDNISQFAEKAYRLQREVDPATVGEYWRTVNGKVLFDGDIFRIKIGNEYIIRFVSYNEEKAAFCIINPLQLKYKKLWDIEQIPRPDWWNEFAKNIEVIGNIHDNPELLKTE